MIKDNMTAQEVFDHVVAHLRQQDCQAMSGDECQYRGNNDTKCAVGCLIKDEEYLIDYEGLPVAGLLTLSAVENDVLFQRLGSHASLLFKLQQLHDYSEPSFWEKGFNQIAEEFGLVVPSKEIKT